MGSFLSYFMNAPVLALAGLAAIPVILHFLLRHKPKKLLFPALRLIQLRKKNNIRRLRLKHIWLLLLRVLVIVILVLAVARPRLPAANYTPNTRETLTLAALVLLAVAVYYSVLYSWRRNRVPNHVYTYRRSLLRGGTGVGLVLLALLAFVWPYTNRVFAEIDAPPPAVARNQPVAAVFLFDTGLTMAYKHENRTRIEAAAAIASGHLKTFPRGSQIAVESTVGSSPILFQTDLVAANDRIEKFRMHPLTARKLDDLLRAAVAKQKQERKQAIDQYESDVYLREIYVFTDLTKSSWDKEPSQRLRAELAELPWLQVYVIDVGIKEPTDVAITDVTLSQQAVVQSAALQVDVKLRGVGKERANRNLTLSFIDATGHKVTKGQAAVVVEPGLEATHRFTLGALSGPFRQGEVRIESTDPLEADDARYFTVAVHPRPNVLIVADHRADAYLWQESLSPSGLKEWEQWFRCTYQPTTKLPGTDLSRYDAVYLINIARPTAEMWKALRKYVEAGGGVGAMLGIPNSDETRQAYSLPDAQAILPAELGRQWSFIATLELYDVSHPIFAVLSKDSGDLLNSTVRKYWHVRPIGGARVLARYTNNRHSPALLVRAVGRGRTLMFTTAVNKKLDWNTLVVSGWPYLELSHQMTHFLIGGSTRQYNFQQGDAVRLYWDRRLATRPRMLRKPRTQVRIGAQHKTRDVENTDEKSLAVNRGDLDEAGNYQLLGNDTKATVLAAFSYNVAPEQSDLTRLTTEQLDEVFGKDRYKIATDTESLDRAVHTGRIGKEVFPLVLFCMIVIFVGEHFVANRFYEAEQAAQHQ
jgi:Aerotolerance regulator N-terminal